MAFRLKKNIYILYLLIVSILARLGVISLINNDGGASLGEFAATERVMRTRDCCIPWLSNVDH